MTTSVPEDGGPDSVVTVVATHVGERQCRVEGFPAVRLLSDDTDLSLLPYSVLHVLDGREVVLRVPLGVGAHPLALHHSCRDGEGNEARPLAQPALFLRGVPARATVRQVMPSRLRHRVGGIRFSRTPPADGGVDPAVLEAASDAVRERMTLRLDYRDEPVPRRVEPHGLVARRGRWYLVAWDLDREDWRSRPSTARPAG